MRSAMVVLGVILASCGSDEALQLESRPAYREPWPVLASVVDRDATVAQERVILARLASPDPLENQWGAYLAARHGVAAATPALVGLLERTNTTTVVEHAVLDALTILGASVPRRTLERVATHFEAHDRVALAAALRDPAEHRDVIFTAWSLESSSFDADADDAPWFGMANALAALRDTAFVGELLASLTGTVRLRVQSAGHSGLGMFGMCVACAIGCGGSHHESSVEPPVGVWSIVEPDEDCTFALPGPGAACLVRSEVGTIEAIDALDDAPIRLIFADQTDALARYDALPSAEPVEHAMTDSYDTGFVDWGEDDAWAPAPDACSEAPRQEDEIHASRSATADRAVTYLAYLLDRDPDALFYGTLDIRHEWRDETAFSAALATARDTITAEYRRLTDAIADAGLMPAGASLLHVPVTIAITDYRHCDRTSRLPSVITY